MSSINIFLKKLFLRKKRQNSKKKMGACKSCGEPVATKQCPICLEVWYCNETCQKQDSCLHILDCENILTFKNNTVKDDKIMSLCKEISNEKRKNTVVNYKDMTIIHYENIMRFWYKLVDQIKVKMMPQCARIIIFNEEKYSIVCSNGSNCIRSDCVYSHCNSNEILFDVALETLMGKEVWDRFALQYRNFSIGGAFQRGHGSVLMYQVGPVRQFYQENKLKMDELQLAAKNIISETFDLWLEFKAIWIDGSTSKQDCVFKWGLEQDIGFAACMTGLARNANMYSYWKSLSENALYMQKPKKYGNSSFSSLF
jgi:hypothetical protein